MSIGIKVAIRCRPFTIDDTLGVKLKQNSEEEGEVELINCDYSTKRFPFTYAWWSAYGYKRHLTGNNMQDADDMLLVNQEMAYADCGLKIKSDLLTGNAVVLFAYGLSGSGKTYTVFGPDAVDAPEAWFKHADPQPLWVSFPDILNIPGSPFILITGLLLPIIVCCRVSFPAWRTSCSTRSRTAGRSR